MAEKTTAREPQRSIVLPKKGKRVTHLFSVEMVGEKYTWCVPFCYISPPRLLVESRE